MLHAPLSCSFDPIERTKQLAQIVKTTLSLSYTYFFKKNPDLQKYNQALSTINQQPFPPARQTFQELNVDQKNPFLMSIGIAMSQMKTTGNILHPAYLEKLLQKKSQADKNPKQWLADRNGYVVRTALQETEFTQDDEQQLIKQLQILGVYNQPATSTMPSYRLSLEIADFVDKYGVINQEKLLKQAQFLKDLGNPLTIFHHYANPLCKPHLFEKKEDISWFAHICAQLVKECPDLTYVCPISQMMGFGMQVARQKMLPPFSCNIDTDQFLHHIVQAQVAASYAIKKVNPHLKVLISHQWKPMKPAHCIGDPRHALECLICSIADRTYNQKFVQLVKPYIDSFDGIALSLYPALYFDTFTPCGNNCTGILDPQSALEAIIKMHQYFPDKEIHIIETGCNNNDPEIKKQFVDMTLHVCKQARDLGIPVKSCYFWGHTNNPYFEWNKLPGTSFFGPFENLSIDSINEYGAYLQSILK